MKTTTTTTWETAILRTFEALDGNAQIRDIYNKIGEFIQLTERHMRPQDAAKGRKAYKSLSQNRCAAIGNDRASKVK